MFHRCKFVARLFPALLLFHPLSRALAATNNFIPASIVPPQVKREFRAEWVATVENIDWPTKPGLSARLQKEEFLTLLDRAVKLNLNAIILQVRPACDALYASKLEPWSYYLTGTMGRAPDGGFDPLAFAVAEAHKRGLELHAWFNPFRAGWPGKTPLSANHIARTHPELVVAYGEQLWLDPGLKPAQDYTLQVVMDVVNRYDIDGVVFDDYFYPYRVKDSLKREVDFPDTGSWQKTGSHSVMSREDWRRDNVNQFVKRAYDSIKSAKPWVKFGISPFGIWQPGYPRQITGLNSFAVLYSDSRKWLADGWVDYLAPQLYWANEPAEQSFPALLKWWEEQNTKHRNVWPGLADNNVRTNAKGWKPEEILNQIRYDRAISSGAPGQLHWSAKVLMENARGLATAIGSGPYAEQALVPPSPWLDANPPGRPRLEINRDGTRLEWGPAGAESIATWIVQVKKDDRWDTILLRGQQRELKLKFAPEAVAVTGVDRCGVASQAVSLKRAGEPSR
jgi:uncharacterized lipoprotein YddW (UPF0748 family)